ncbi:3'-5' exonuclease [Vacuolonema iberomarrocanum]|uniref:3'-5' exonuclease n=1 Tax=Vacuolonema iberomarrocanum TaxID=3454632 RepID=UPI003F6E0A54
MSPQPSLSAMRSPDLLAHYRQLSQQPLTVVDLETTGAYPNTSRITEIAIVQGMLADGITHQQSSLVNPECPIPDKIVQVTGITSAMVSQAAPTREVLPEFWSPLNSGVITAHNLSFDYGFLTAEFRRMDWEFARSPMEQLCTVQLSRLLLAELPSRSLPALVRHFRFPVARSHRAEADALACWLLANHLLNEILNESDAALLKRFARQWIPLKDAAQLLGSTLAKGRSRLVEAGVAAREVGRGRSKTRMYRRGDVEQLLEGLTDDPTQLSIF